ncbi:amidohydrolase family protein [Daejeonella sp.]|uniref:amidohydrolase family protein n=1 Tax=Daejeonella sp. TaxID=2805397 RepID=UPI0039832208
MKFLSKYKSLSIFTLFTFIWCSSSGQNKSTSGQTKSEFYTKEDFRNVEKFDTHVHLNIYDTTFISQAIKDKLRLLTVNVNPAYYPSVEEQQNVALRMVRDFPDRLAYATTFTVENWGTREWLPQTLSYLKNSFKQGAIAVKIWKNIGMGLKDKDGKFVMIDDARFDPVLEMIEKNNITLLGHIGEPRNAWLPVDQMTVSNDKGYFTSHPEYHMFKHPENPSYEDQVNSRDNMLKKHPTLRFVGAHLGSLEWNVDELAKRLDQFPNMAVDMAARIVHLQSQSAQNWQKVRNFMIKYQDRLIYATDHGVDAKSDLSAINKRLHDTRIRDWTYFATNDNLTSSSFSGIFKGLQLPKPVIDKIYRINAQKWFPGIDNLTFQPK